MVDPDAPFADNPLMAPWLHWIAMDIPGGKLAARFNPNNDTYFEVVGKFFLLIITYHNDVQKTIAFHPKH